MQGLYGIAFTSQSGGAHASHSSTAGHQRDEVPEGRSLRASRGQTVRPPPQPYPFVCVGLSHVTGGHPHPPARAVGATCACGAALLRAAPLPLIGRSLAYSFDSRGKP